MAGAEQPPDAAGVVHPPEPPVAEVERFLEVVYQSSGIDFRAYARRAVQRRLHHLMLQEGVVDLGQLGARVLRDGPSAARFAQRMCVGVSSMFRDPGFFRALREVVLPLLRPLPFVRVWHAGCASGEEVYSTAILLREEGLLRRCRLYATDVDEAALARAARGAYPLDVMREYTQQYQQAGGKAAFSDYYQVCGGGAVFDPSLRRGAVFARHNLATDASFNAFHLVLCRNVLIYFEPSLQERAHRLLWASLAQDGVLGLGQREIVPPQLARGRYRELDGGHKLYRRVG